jgi:haloalkane dehalogenase
MVVRAEERDSVSDMHAAGHTHASVRGGRLHYVDEGTGPPILFVHGTPTWSYEWRHVIAALRGSHRCIAPDHLGFGLSERPEDAEYTPEAHAARLSEFVDGLGLDRFALVVHDFGGPIGLPLALDRPGRVTRLVVLNTWMWSLAEDAKIRRAAPLLGGPVGRFLYRRANLSLRVIMPTAWGKARPLTREMHRPYLERFPDAESRGRVLWPLARALTASEDWYASLWSRRAALQGIPSLLIWGMRDPAFGVEYLARWKEILPGAQAVELAESGHWPQEEEPEQVSRAIVGLPPLEE